MKPETQLCVMSACITAFCAGQHSKFAYCVWRQAHWLVSRNLMHTPICQCQAEPVYKTAAVTCNRGQPPLKPVVVKGAAADSETDSRCCCSLWMALEDCSAQQSETTALDGSARRTPSQAQFVPYACSWSPLLLRGFYQKSTLTSGNACPAA